MDTFVSAQKIELIHWITEINDPSVLAQVNTIKEKSVVVSYAEQQSIERGLKDFQLRKTVLHTQAKKRYEKWL